MAEALYARNTSVRHRAALSRETPRSVKGCREHQSDRRRSVRPAPATLRVPPDSELPHLPGAIEPALNVAGAAAGEITHRQRQQLATQKIQDRRVQTDRCEGEKIFLGERRPPARNTSDGAIPSRMIFSRLMSLSHDHLVHHHFVKTGNSICRQVTTTASSRTCRKCLGSSRETGAPRRIVALLSGACSNAVV